MFVKCYPERKSAVRIPVRAAMRIVGRSFGLRFRTRRIPLRTNRKRARRTQTVS
jgi:hypothetical protein